DGHDDVTLEDNDPNVDDGKLRVTFAHLSFFDGAHSSSTFVINSPVPSGVPGDHPSLIITTGAGGDSITVKSLDPLFQADLLLYGDHSGAPSPEPDPAHDVVRFQGDVFTHGGLLETFADEISVDPGVTISTLV